MTDCETPDSRWDWESADPRKDLENANRIAFDNMGLPSQKEADMTFKEFNAKLIRRMAAAVGLPADLLGKPIKYLIWNRPKASWLGPIEDDGSIGMVFDRADAGRFTADQAGGILAASNGRDEVIVRDRPAAVREMFRRAELDAMVVRMEAHDKSLASEVRSGPSPYYSEIDDTEGRSPTDEMKERKTKSLRDEADKN